MSRQRLKVDIAALQETRLADSGSIKEKDYSFFWQGKAESEVSEHGVGFAVKNTLLNTVDLKCNGSERLLSLRLNTSIGHVTLICSYAHTLSSTPEAKDMFYDNLSSALSEIPTTEQVIILGDLNAGVGSDNSAWDSCIGSFGVGKVKENGQRLLEVCSLHSLCVTNTYFKTKPQHRVSWRHPRSKHLHQLDLIMVRRKCLKFVKLTRSYHSADCDTDHSLVYFILAPVIRAKRDALATYKAKPTQRNLLNLKEARAYAQRTARICANEYWVELSESIQLAAQVGNIRGMYEGIQKALGPSQNKTTPLKSTTGEIITDKCQQMHRWVEHYSELYATTISVSDSALKAIIQLPTMNELDETPTLSELNKAIDNIAARKAPGCDGIPKIF
uniref:Endonuclease/exonuclease/phosphatase domain-containing protein n=1 Tax=Biomphalaria glabrata TaxID=6526 RepID=A0A2C9KAG3_BIOGL